MTKTTVFTGKSSYGGFVQGSVRVVHTHDDIRKFKNGEVLVTGMTDINYAPAIKKASAIVTEKGGVTCHAAIVARELRKPCIVSARGITKMLKTGDQVVVDATAGEVKIVD